MMDFDLKTVTETCEFQCWDMGNWGWENFEQEDTGDIYIRFNTTVLKGRELASKR